MKGSRLPLWEWGLVLLLVLTGWALRVWQPMAVPPGWRDDELINVHALTGEVLAGRPTLYFTGASGHEPLYHTLHAGLLAMVGMNVMGGHLLSIACGTVTIPLTYVLGRRLLGSAVGLVAAALLASSFWSMMYSRIALRHAMVLPFALATLYGLWGSAFIGHRLSPVAFHQLRPVVCGLTLAAALYTYTVARLLPLILLAFGLYLALVRRDRFCRWWRPVLAAMLVAAMLTTPLWIAIARGRSEAASQGIGADARIAELSHPLRELRAGNPRPLLENIWTTLGMFHATGDPEWLYNLPDRPVFGAVGAVSFFIGLVLCFWHWRRSEYGFLLLWLIIGISPALITLPPASLGHTILAQPAAYLLAALPLSDVTGCRLQVAGCRLQVAGRKLQVAGRRSQVARRTLNVVFCLLLFTSAARDLYDYFVTWPERGMVRFLYRADYRQAAFYLDARPEVVDVAVGSTLMGPWDRLALADDLQREDVRVRLFNPQRALLIPAGPVPAVLLVGFPEPEPTLAALLDGALVEAEGRLRLYRPSADGLPAAGLTVTFGNGLAIAGGRLEEGAAPGGKAHAWLIWEVARPLDLPPMPVVANPPPPGVYAGPRLSAFAHLYAGETLVAVDDGLWVDPTTLYPGDRFLQLHRFSLPSDAPADPYRLEVGLYDPMTGERWAVVDEEGHPVGDRYVVP